MTTRTPIASVQPDNPATRLDVVVSECEGTSEGSSKHGTRAVPMDGPFGRRADTLLKSQESCTAVPKQLDQVETKLRDQTVTERLLRPYGAQVSAAGTSGGNESREVPAESDARITTERTEAMHLTELEDEQVC